MTLSRLSPLSAAGRVLSFRLAPEDWDALGPSHIALGLGCTWIAGIGRHWDDTRAGWVQQSGVGSLIYVLLLSLFLWLLVLPLGPRTWTLPKLVAYISLCAPPAFLYAIPVEMMLPMDTAQSLNLGFLAVVSIYRVGLLWILLKRLAGLSVGRTVLAALLPLALIVVGLSISNLAQGAVEIMGGLRGPRTPDDAANHFVLGLGFLAYTILPFLLLIYVGIALNDWLKRRAARARTQQSAKEP